MFNAAPNSQSRRELARQVTSISAANQTFGIYEHCPDCGAGRFTEHAVRTTTRPADQ